MDEIIGLSAHRPERPMPHAHCPECLGATGTHRTDCSLRDPAMSDPADIQPDEADIAHRAAMHD